MANAVDILQAKRAKEEGTTPSPDEIVAQQSKRVLGWYPPP